MGPHGTDYASVSANAECGYGMVLEEMAVARMSSRRYATRGKQKAVQEIITTKGHCSSALAKKHALKANAADLFSVRCMPSCGGERLEKMILKKMIPKVRENSRNPKACIRSLGQKNPMCPYVFCDEPQQENCVLKKSPKRSAKGKAPTIARPFKGSKSQASSKQRYRLSKIGGLEKENSRHCSETLTNVPGGSELDHGDDGDGDDNNDDGDGEDASDSVKFRVEIATQTSDTSSYTAEIDLDCLLDDNSDTDVSEDEDSSDYKQDADEPAESGEVEMSTTTVKVDCDGGSSPATTHNLAGYSADSYQDTQAVGQDLETSTAVSEPIVSFTNCPISGIPPFSQSQHITVNYSEPVSTSTNVAQPAMIAYSGNTFPLQTCAMVGQNLILDDGARSMLLSDASTQVVNNMSIQMQGFSVQHGLSTLPVENISGLSYVHPALNVGTGQSQSLLPNTIATIDNSMATPSVAVVPNHGLAFPGNQSLQVNLSNVAIGTRCPAKKPDLSTPVLSHLCPARSLASILPKMLPGPIPTLTNNMLTKCVTSALPPMPATHVGGNLTCSATVKLLDVCATATMSLPPHVAPVVSCTSPATTFRAVSSRFMLAAQPPASVLYPLPPPIMAPGFYQVHLEVACTSVVTYSCVHLCQLICHNSSCYIKLFLH